MQSFKLGDGSGGAPPPDDPPHASQTWHTFLTSQAPPLVSIAFSAVPTLTGRTLLVFIVLGSRL